MLNVSESKPTRSINRLLIISHVTHYAFEGELYAYGPYTREIAIWADLFQDVQIAAPCRYGLPPKDAVCFTRPNIHIVPQPEAGGDHLAAKLHLLLMLPVMVWSLCRALITADAVHVRCPGNLGLLGTLLAPLFSRRLIAKYAGQWNGYTAEPWTIRLQRKILGSRWWRGPVTVYGEWPDQPPHVVPFFTSMMSDAQVAQAVAVADEKFHTPVAANAPLRVLFSGRLAWEKRVPALLEAVRIASTNGARVELTILGDGPERDRLEREAARLEIQNRVRFAGALPFTEAIKLYEWADCLVLPSTHSEGWPKVIAEAMCNGLICIAVRHGQIPVMLEGRGVLLDTGSPEEIAAALIQIARSPVAFRPLMRAASRWSRQYSLDSLREALRQLLAENWQVPPHSLQSQSSFGRWQSESYR